MKIALFSITPIGNGRKSVYFVCESRYKISSLMLVYLILILAICRETYWISTPKVVMDRDFDSNYIKYKGYCRFIFGKWFGRWVYPDMQYENYISSQVAYKLDINNEN